MEEYVAVPTQREDTERSLALILQAQFLEKQLEPILKATEVREHEVITYTSGLMAQFVNEIIGTSEEDLLGAQNKEEENYIKRKLALKEAILRDPNNMVYLIANSWWRFFGILRQSLKRQSRKEGVAVAVASIKRAFEGEELGFGERFLAKLGLGRYKPVYVPKEER